MKPSRKLSLVKPIVISLIIVFFALLFFNAGFQEFIFFLIFEEETVYAKGYSLESWKEVKINDTVERVIQLLGEPLQKTKADDGDSLFFYSKQGPKDTNYRERTIIFNREGKVTEIIRTFYFD